MKPLLQYPTSTGTWIIPYNGENRPVRFRNNETDITVDCAYDSQGRRFEKKVTVAGTPSGAAVPANPLRFSSEHYDSELDLVYYNYRHYSPTLGRFLSRDPIEEQGGLNLYAFTRNNPVREWDILGRAFFCPGDVIPSIHMHRSLVTGQHQNKNGKAQSL